MQRHLMRTGSQVKMHVLEPEPLVTYPLGGGYVLFSPLFLTALSLSLSLSFHTFFWE